jgi:pantetheine-phosphate adenylyltransferase
VSRIKARTRVAADPRRVAVFPGSFDPLTVGHCDLIARSLALFDHVIVAIGVNANKRTLFTMDERLQLIRDAFPSEPRVETATFEGLLVHFAAKRNACAIVRGLRSTGDFAYELPMTQMNRALAPAIDTVFLTCEPSHAFVSSSLVKEVVTLHGDITPYVPAHVAAALRARLASRP